MENGAHSTIDREEHGHGEDAVSSTEEECESDADQFNTIMEHGSADTDDGYFDDGFSADSLGGDEEFVDPFETLPEMDIIRHNCFDN